MSTINYKKHILRDFTDDIFRKCREKLETIQHISGACSALAQGDYTHRHIAHQDLAIKCGLSKGPSMPYYKYE